MAKRLLDIAVSLAGLVLCWPLLLVAALGIRLSSRGPVLYRAQRAGRGGKPFTMHKFRTMHLGRDAQTSAITSSRDDRVFRFGAWLRAMKIDELPQIYDVLRGKMSLVGPRPEDVRIVRDFYGPQHMETLAVRPGLASPGSIFNYTHAEKLIGKEDPERDYVEKVLPAKLALELVYVRNASFWYDCRIILRTICVIVMKSLGKRHFPDPPELAALLTQQTT